MLLVRYRLTQQPPPVLCASRKLTGYALADYQRLDESQERGSGIHLPPRLR
jgi:hypothetical protein